MLLVDEAVHLLADLLDGGLDLLAVDIDVYPAGDALCNCMILQRATNRRHG